MYEFACLPFRLSIASAPRVFTKLMKPVVAQLGKKGIRLIIYLGDILIKAEILANRHAQTACNLLEALGFVINYQKSNLAHQRKMEFLGFLVNSQAMTLALPLQGSQSSYFYYPGFLSSSSTLLPLTGKQKQSS